MVYLGTVKTQVAGIMLHYSTKFCLLLNLQHVNETELFDNMIDTVRLSNCIKICLKRGHGSLVYYCKSLLHKGQSQTDVIKIYF